MSTKIVWELDDLLSVVELAKSVEGQVQSVAPLDNDNQPAPLRVSVGDATREGWAAHIIVEHGTDTYVDFNYEERR